MLPFCVSAFLGARVFQVSGPSIRLVGFGLGFGFGAGHVSFILLSKVPSSTHFVVNISTAVVLFAPARFRINTSLIHLPLSNNYNNKNSPRPHRPLKSQNSRASKSFLAKRGQALIAMVPMRMLDVCRSTGG